VSGDNVNLSGHSLVALAAEDIAQKTKVPVLSGTRRTRAIWPGMMSARTLKSGALNPMTTSR